MDFESAFWIIWSLKAEKRNIDEYTWLKNLKFILFFLSSYFHLSWLSESDLQRIEFIRIWKELVVLFYSLFFVLRTGHNCLEKHPKIPQTQVPTWIFSIGCKNTFSACLLPLLTLHHCWVYVQWLIWISVFTFDKQEMCSHSVDSLINVLFF